MNIRNKLSMLSYRVKSSLFSWKKDKDGDLALVVGGLVSFLKYKNGTIIHLRGAKEFPLGEAGKYQGRE